MKGGFRSLAGRHPGGRPLGAKDRVKRLRRPSKRPSPEQIAEAHERARAFLLNHEEPLIEEIMTSDDLRAKFELWKLLKCYGDGPPQQRLEITTRRSPEQILEELAARRGAIDSEAIADAIPMQEVAQPALAPAPPQIAASVVPESPVAPPQAAPAPPLSAFEEWLASPEGQRASPQLIEVNRAILERSNPDRLLGDPFAAGGGDDR